MEWTLSTEHALETERTLYIALAQMGERHRAVSESPSMSTEEGPLTPFELRLFSQNGEDGVLAEILTRVGAGERYFVEFGVESGREGNCVYLADIANWRGLFMDSDAHAFTALQRKYRTDERVRTDCAMVTPANVQQLFAAADVPPEPTVLSIDVDGSDYWIWEAIDDYRPRVLVIEYNSALDPHRRLVQPAALQDGWDGTEYFGASLGAMRALGERKGYRLVHAELCGVNAFFVRQDLAEGRFPDVEDVPLRGAPNYFQRGQGHPPDLGRRRYLDLDSGELVSVEPLADAPTLPAQNTLPFWRERARSAEEHLERANQAAVETETAYQSMSAAYASAREDYERVRNDYENALAALETNQREGSQREQSLQRNSTLLAERNAALRLAADELAELRAQTAELETRLASSTAALTQLRTSLSWRVTAPLRILTRGRGG
jgi:hypothetical protein